MGEWEMGKYRVLRFEFPASSSPHFEFPAAENSVIRAENSILKVYLSCPLADNSVMLAENSDTKAHSSYPRSGKLGDVSGKLVRLIFPS